MRLVRGNGYKLMLTRYANLTDINDREKQCWTCKTRGAGGMPKESSSSIRLQDRFSEALNKAMNCHRDRHAPFSRGCQICSNRI